MNSRKVKRILSLAGGIFLLMMVLPRPGFPQQGGYELQPAPDLWYNDVDGIRVGLRLRGAVPGTFEDGPHRLDMGVWVGTWWPDLPVSYHLTFTEPIQALSEFRSEANVRFLSTVRTGIQRHGFSLNKRWQSGFEEREYRELSLYGRSEERFDRTYLPYPGLWREGWLWITGAELAARGLYSGGEWTAEVEVLGSVAGEHPFVQTRLDVRNQIGIGDNFRIYSRFFTGLTSSRTPEQYLFSRSMPSPAGWIERGLTRAKGTIPMPWLEEGFIQPTGGPSLRGYVGADIREMNRGEVPLFGGMAGMNLELQVPNPLGSALNRISGVGELLEFRSYLFLDAGTSPGLTGREEGRLLGNAGPGFMLSLNIPDYLGKPRGFAIRYDLPLWLSHPGGENSFAFRHIVGLGAVISL